jgi:hypothetical protein
MSIGVVPRGAQEPAPARRTRGLLPEPAPRTGAHGYAGKRVRDDVREGVAVMVFSLLTAVLIALTITVLARIAG